MMRKAILKGVTFLISGIFIQFGHVGAVSNTDNKLILGIDLGNENSVVCAAERGGVDLIVNEISGRQTPSAIFFGDDRRYFGEHSGAKASARPQAYASQFRRLVGNKESIVTTLEGKPVSLKPAQVLSMYLGHLDKIACREKNGRVSSCVVSVPAFFGPKERAAVMDAGKINGFPISEVINDGTALALAYGLFRKDAQQNTKVKNNVLFIDFGHSCTQATVCEYTKNGAKVLSHQFCYAASGHVLDDLLFNHFKKELASIDFISNPKAAFRLKNACARLKKTLSANTEASTMVECIDGDIDAYCKLTRQAFEDMMLKAGVGESVLSLCWKSLESSGLKIQEITNVEVVGGSSYVPFLSRALSAALASCDEHLEEQHLPPIRRSLNAGEAVGTGCALRAAMTSPLMKVRPFKLIDCFGGNQAVSINWGGYNCGDGGYLDIQPSTTLPYKKMVEVPVFSKDFELRISAGYNTFDSEEKVEQTSLGDDFVECSIKLQSDDKKNVNLGKDTSASIKAIVGYSSSGPFINEPYLEMKEGDEGGQEFKHKSIKLNFNYIKPLGLTKKELSCTKEVEKKFDDCDRAIIECMNAKNSLENYVYEMRDSFGEYGQYGSFLNSKTLARFLQSLDDTEEWLYLKHTYSKSAYEKKLNTLKEISSKAKRLKAEREIAEQELQSAENLLEASILEISRNSSTPPSKVDSVYAEIREAQQWISTAKLGINETPLYEELPIKPPDITERMSVVLEKFHTLLADKSKTLATEEAEQNNDSLLQNEMQREN